MILVLGMVSTDPAVAQVATAPLLPDQRLTNPAALSFRVLRGHSLSANRKSEVAKDPSGNSGVLTTDVDTFSLNGSWAQGVWSFETNLLPQNGKETITSNSQNPSDPSSSNEFQSERKIGLVPAQVAVAARVGNWGSFGIKVLYAGANFKTDEKYANATPGTDENGAAVTYYDSFSTVGDQKSSVMSLGVGTVVRLGNSGLWLGLSSENMSFNDDINSTRTTTTTIVGTTTQTSTTSMPISSRLKKDVRKDTIGIGYLSKLSGNDVFRSDLSYETMPALKPVGSFNAPFEKGELVRWVTEATWSYFHAGVQVTSTSGYYVDPYEYIPYLLGSSNLTGKNVVGYGFFGGLKSAKGHSFGASYFRSSEVKEKFFANSTPSKLDTTTSSFGLSYSWVF